MTPRSTTTIAAVIGDPVRHSLSPAIHNAAFDHLGLDWVYGAFEVPVGGGADAVRAMAALGIGGLSVTMPLKDEVALAADERTEAVDRLGGANTLFWRDGRIVADSTDGDGFLSSVTDQTQWRAAGSSAAVLGAGGAARAIIEALGRAGADVVVINRNADRASRAASVHPRAEVGSPADLATASLVVNATSVGMTGGPAPDEVPLGPDWITDGMVVADIVYHPQRTPLLAAAERVGAETVGGLGMLVGQAALQFERWTHKPAPRAVMAAAVELT